MVLSLLGLFGYAYKNCSKSCVPPPPLPHVSPCRSEDVKGQLWDIKGEMLMRRVHKDLQAPWLAVLSIFERVQGGKDDPGSLLLRGWVSPAVAGQRGRVEQEVDRGHVDFDELLLQVGKVLLQTHTEIRNSYRHGNKNRDAFLLDLLHTIHVVGRRLGYLNCQHPLLFKLYITCTCTDLLRFAQVDLCIKPGSLKENTSAF